MRPEKKLTNRIVETAEPGRHSDGGGLYLDVKSPHSRFWSFRYTFEGKTREMGLGPAGSAAGAMLLSGARKKAAKLQQMVSSGADPLDESVTDPPNLYQEYVRERDGFEEGSGDLSVLFEFARARDFPTFPPSWESNLAEFRALGTSTRALVAIALWPGDKPLAPELRWFLQRALMPLLEETSVDAEAEKRDKRSEIAAVLKAANEQVIIKLGLRGGSRGQTPALYKDRRMLDASLAKHLMEEAMKTERNRQRALFVVGRKMGVGKTAVEELLVESAAITKAEKDAAASTA